MSGTQKRGFRLPWGPQGGLDDGDSAAPATTDAAADGTPTETGAEPHVSPDAQHSSQMEQAMDTSPVGSDGASAASAVEPLVTADGTWPDVDWAAVREATRETSPSPSVQAEPAASAAKSASTARAGRRENPLVAGLVKAMREAAVASREETTTRLRAEAASRIETIRDSMTGEAAELRKRAEDDVAGIREWSKAEIARLRQETEDRIAARRAELAAESERHAASIERRVEEVQATIDAYEAEMDEFFQRLLAEDDPARLAALAEQAPEPPDVSEIEATIADSEPVKAAELEAPATSDDPEAAGAAEDEPTVATHDEAALEAAAAAEAEAAATEGLDLSNASEHDWPVVAMSAARRGEAPAADAHPDGSTETSTTRLVVNGLNSVADISAFKGALGSVPGVRSVSVSTGERGAFVFTVSHAGADLRTAVPELPGFGARVSDDGGDDLTVNAHEPAA